MPFASSEASFYFERHLVSAHASRPASVVSFRLFAGLAPSCGAVVTICRRMIPFFRSTLHADVGFADKDPDGIALLRAVRIGFRLAGRDRQRTSAPRAALARLSVTVVRGGI